MVRLFPRGCTRWISTSVILCPGNEKQQQQHDVSLLCLSVENMDFLPSPAVHQPTGCFSLSQRFSLVCESRVRTSKLRIFMTSLNGTDKEPLQLPQEKWPRSRYRG